ncbi:hypothetical protein FQA47_025570 [Oryzias melastigma]|uniref:Uncharacterized protein n=1 Tax=Oryzias melastigma TaxID=30732 RepID=A0A834C975_ORYME|nr:hypothetical protein FQA47_025570 [Oryzias melastigma]
MTDMCYPTEISSLMDFGTADCTLGKGIQRVGEEEREAKEKGKRRGRRLSGDDSGNLAGWGHTSGSGRL